MPTLTVNGHTIQVDPIDADLLKLDWVTNSEGYALHFGQGGRPIVRRMHRVIMERVIDRPLNRWELIDHINGDKLDNRRANLRICNNSENQHNRDLPAHNTTGYKGVYKNPRCATWHAAITVNYKKIYLGSYRTREDAARAYDRAARELAGEFARGNLR